MGEEVQFSSVRERIAALKLDQVGRQPGSGPAPRESTSTPKSCPPAPPPRPPRPAESLKRPSLETRTQTTNNPPLQSNAAASARIVGNQPAGPQSAVETLPPPSSSHSFRNGVSNQRPALPARPTQKQASQQPQQQQPPLPPRRPSAQSSTRRSSIESNSSALSERSYASGLSTSTSSIAEGQPGRVKAPPYDPARLPALPPKRQKEEVQRIRVPLRAVHSSPAVTKGEANAAASTETRAVQPPLPQRPNNGRGETRDSVAQRASALSFAMNKDTEMAPPLPGERPSADTPPPIPISSRPNLAELERTKPKVTAVAAASAQGSCLKCRDFSAPDAHAARFPRESIPSSDLACLSHQLTSPFPSATDKARAIFTWLHHNIAYDTEAFFSGNRKPATPASTFSSGLAVCQGYANLFADLATHAGLESIVISGHGKGYGHRSLPPNSPVPAYSSNHAWNVVRIDDGRWKLVDPCWGAGVVSGPDQPYKKRFAPQCFTMDNDEFGARHFPTDNAHFYREDGRPSVSWEEYILADAGHAERLTIYDGARSDHGIAEGSFAPAQKRIVLSACGPAVRFRFAKVCPHWDGERLGIGKPYVFVLHVGGRDGRDQHYIPFDTDGQSWWCEVPAGELGAPGMKVSVYFVRTLGEREGRGVTKEEYLRSKGKVGMSFGGVAAWELC